MSATCEQVQEKVAAYVDREMAGSDRDAFEAQLVHGGGCSAAVAGQAQVKEVVRTRAPRIYAPFHLRARIRRNLAEGVGFAEAVRRIFAFYPGQAAAALAGAAAVMIAATLLSGRLWAGFADPIAYHAEALITGRIICADCALMQKTGTPAPHAASHHLVIQAQDGKIWTIVLSPMGEELLQRTDIVSHAVQARGYAFPRAGYIQVTDFQFPQN